MTSTEGKSIVIGYIDTLPLNISIRAKHFRDSGQINVLFTKH